ARPHLVEYRVLPPSPRRIAMPLLDHFHPPLQPQHRWESFHSNWATRLADALSDSLPPEFQTEEYTLFPDTFEVRIFTTTGGLTLVGVIELISPGNKDRAEERRSFAIKCASYLRQGASVILIDIVTNRRGNLHNETMRLIEVPRDM